MSRELWFVDSRSPWRWVIALLLLPCVCCGSWSVLFTLLASLHETIQGEPWEPTRSLPLEPLLWIAIFIGPAALAILAAVKVLGPGYRARSVKLPER